MDASAVIKLLRGQSWPDLSDGTDATRYEACNCDFPPDNRRGVFRVSPFATFEAIGEQRRCSPEC